MGITVEAMRLAFRNKIFIPLTVKRRGKKLHCKDFTIISNNCWGGTVYESYGMQKLSPTVGMFIMPDDYLKFISRLDYYLDQPLVFIDPDLSKWKRELEGRKNWKTYLIGKLDDIELHMLHYHDENSAKSKWEARIKRVNNNRLLFKFNDQNGAQLEHIIRFVELPLKNKLCFVANEDLAVADNVIYIKQPEGIANGVKASREPFGESKHINLTEYINLL